MYCPNCGNTVSEKDNYCNVCGKKLKKVNVIVKEEKENSFDETIVFKPSSLQGIDNTDSLKEIMDAVDKKIKKNIHDYQVKGTSEDPEFIGPKKKTKDEFKAVDEFSKNSKKIGKDYVSSHMTQKELIEKVRAELNKEDLNNISDSKTNNYRSSQDIISEPKKSFKESFLEKTEKKPSTEKNRTGIKKLWHDFINEDDDEFSILSTLKSSKDLEKDIDYEISNQNQPNIEDTMSVPKVVTQTDLDKSIIRSKLKEAEEDKKAQRKKSLEKQKEKPNNFDSLKRQDKKFDGETLKSKVASKLKKKDKKLSKKHQKVSETTEIKTEKIEVLDQNNISSTNSTKLNKGIFYNFFNIINEALDGPSFKKRTNVRILLICGILLTFLNIVLAKGFKLQILALLALKLIFDSIQYYSSLSVATQKAFIDCDYNEEKHKAIIIFFISKLFFTVAFIFSPIGKLFEFDLLSALTPMPFATIILIILSTVLATSLFWKKLDKLNRVDFIGWYTLMFILFELLFKMIWFFINFTLNTLF